MKLSEEIERRSYLEERVQENVKKLISQINNYKGLIDNLRK